MKKVLFFIFLLLLSLNVFSQINVKDILSKVSLKGPVALPDSVQMKLLVEQLLQIYGNSFIYYGELKTGHYKFNLVDGKNSEYSLEIIGDSKREVKISVNKLQSPLGGYVFTFDNKEIERLLKPYATAFGFTRQISPISIIERNNILVDQDILPIEELQPDERKIMDKKFTTDNFNDQNGDDLELYKLCQAGKLIPYSSGHSKMITIDNEYSSIIYFDEGISADDDNPLNRCYGYSGDDAGEFMNPMGLCVGRMYSQGNNDIYPVYIADMYNLRIRKVNFVADNTFNKLGTFENSSFQDIAVITYPYDIGFFNNAIDTANDKIWVTQAQPQPFQNYLTCLSKSGAEMQRFTGYKNLDNGQTYFFEPGTLTRLAVYNNAFGYLCFIDNIRNCLVSCLLNEDGLGNVEHISDRDDYIVANEVITFPSEHVINSVSIQKTPLGSNVWPSLWVTSPSYIHHLKINKSANIQYLASAKLPRNSLEYFTGMRNTICTDNVYDIYTIENWTMSRGLRKYYPFCDIHSESLENYCNDSLDIMKFKATFTNDCWLYMTASRKNRSGNWETVKIRKLNGSSVDTTSVIKWQYAGWNQGSSDLFIDLQLELPIEDYVLGDSVSLTIRMYPEYSNPLNYFNSDHIEKVYKGYVNKACLPRSGGCPFLYVKDENNDFLPDNNVLHKMEFSEPDVNITDRYKLRITPTVSNGAAELYLVENENDFAFIEQVKVYAVDYPNDKKMGITEDNKIVIFDSVSVIASDSVMLNNTNITSNVNYFNPSSNLTNGFVNDSLYAHFSYPDKNNIKKYIQNSEIKSQSSSKEQRAKSIESTKSDTNRDLPIAFITNFRNLANPIPSIKDTAGLLTATSIYSNTVSKIFARREMESVVILPLFNDTDRVDHFNINWQSNFRMKYIGIANLNYSNYSMNEMPMIKGSSITISTDSAITTALTSVDGNYGEVNLSALIKMTFDVTQLPSIPAGYKREYVIDVTGNYIKGDENVSSKVNQNIPLTYSLSQNYPNPFNPVTKINYELPKNAQVNLVIYDILGREVLRLVNNDFKQAGRYTVEFNGQNYASGVYFYRIEVRQAGSTTGDFVQAKKMVLVK